MNAACGVTALLGRAVAQRLAILHYLGATDLLLRTMSCLVALEKCSNEDDSGSFDALQRAYTSRHMKLIDQLRNGFDCDSTFQKHLR